MDLDAVINRPALTCHTGTPLAAVAGLMRDSNTGSVVVVNGEGHLVGIVTDRDLVVRGLDSNHDTGRPVQEFMSTNPAFIYEEEDVVNAALRMVERGCRRLPVLQADGEVVGVVALDDLLLYFAHLSGLLANVVGRIETWKSIEQREMAQQASSRR